MPFQEKFVSDEIFSTLSNWLIHFLWYLLEEFMQRILTGASRSAVQLRDSVLLSA